MTCGVIEKTKPIKANFKAQTTINRGKMEARYRISEAGRRWTTERVDDVRLIPRQSSLILHAMHVLCRQAKVIENRSEHPIISRIKQKNP